jgi:predicted membrane-bound spermidine synthase/tetratricopeptide (TPR) repeat protein
MASHNRQRSLVLSALFLSGLAGLMHEVVWAKLLANLTGSTAKSHAVVLSVFMGGLAIGAIWFGRGSDKRERPLKVYVVLEVLIGLYCLALPWITRAAGFVYEQGAAATFESPGIKLVLRLILSLATVLLPAVLMGGTLPVLARYLVEEVAQTRRQVAGLYALNNLGAVLGCGAAGFYLLPAFGIYGSLIGASSMNFLAAGLVWIANARTEYVASGTSAGEAHAHAALPAYNASQFRVTLWALALSGFAAMGYEVVFIRIISLGFGSSNYSFTVMLMCFITGIGVGSLIISQVDVRRPMWWLAFSQLAVIVSLLAVTPIIERLPFLVGWLRTQMLEFPPDITLAVREAHEVPLGFGKYLVGESFLCFAMLLVPTVFIGMGFPLVSQIQARSMSNLGGTIGSTYAWNTIGNVLGVVVTSLLLMPNLGMEGSLHLNLVLNLVAALLLLAAAQEMSLVPRVSVLATALVCVGLYAVGLAGWSSTVKRAQGHLRLREGLPSDADAETRKSHPATNFDAWKEKYVSDKEPHDKLHHDWDKIYLAEDADTAVMGVRRDRLAAIYVNGKGDASTGPLDMITFVLTGHIPMFLLPDAKSVMVIGHGSGVTTGGMLLHPIERLDLVEISRAVIGADYLFADMNHQCLKDPRTHLYLDDARTFLRTVPRKYDLIVSQPSNPWIAGIGSLFTVDFFKDCKARLNPGGAMVVWFHHYEQSDETIALIMRTINSVFPNIESFLTYNSDVIALASMEPLTPDFKRMEERFDQPAIRADLGRVTVFDLATVLAYHGVTSPHFHALAGEGPLNTDDHQRLEYMGAHNMFLGRDAHLLEGGLSTEESEALAAKFFDPSNNPLLVLYTAWLDEQEKFFAFKSDGTSDSMLDRYIAWRASLGQPVTRRELMIGAQTMGNILLENHRLARTMRARAEAAADAPITSQSPARGALAPIESMEFSESFNRGVYCAFVGESDTALALMRRALELNPTSGDVITHLSQLVLSKASVLLRQWSTLQAEARAKESEGKADEAKALNDQLAAFAAAHKQELEGIFNEAEKVLLDGLARRTEATPVDTNVDLTLAGLYLQLNKFDKAVPIYLRLIESDERNPVAMTRMGEITGIGGDVERAEKYFRQAVERDPKLHDAVANLARMLMDKALDETDPAVKRELRVHVHSILERTLLDGPIAPDLKALLKEVERLLALPQQLGPMLPVLPPTVPESGQPAAQDPAAPAQSPTQQPPTQQAPAGNPTGG